MWSMFTDAELLVQLCPLFIHAQSICFMTHESQQVCSSANRPICRLGGRALCGKPALTTVHPHTDPWKAGSSAEGEGASLPVGILPSEQMGPSPGSRRTRMSALAASVFLICVFNLQETNSCSERLSLQSRSREESKKQSKFSSHVVKLGEFLVIDPLQSQSPHHWRGCPVLLQQFVIC